MINHRKQAWRLRRLGFKHTLEILNELEREGVIDRYAIGGAVASVFYMDPIATEDLDVFVVLPGASDPLMTLDPIYDALFRRGCQTDGEHVVIAGVPVQLLPAYNALVEEALRNARDVDIMKVSQRAC